MLDKYDTAILSALQMDGRITWSQLATRVSLSASAVQRRVESLVDRGVIENFTINLNEAALGEHRTCRGFPAPGPRASAGSGLSHDLGIDRLYARDRRVRSRFIRKIYRWRAPEHAGRQGCVFFHCPENRETETDDDRLMTANAMDENRRLSPIFYPLPIDQWDVMARPGNNVLWWVCQ